MSFFEWPRPTGSMAMWLVIADWMDRKDNPYLIFWRNQWHIIDRSKWSSGVEPGSCDGPGLFILGFDDRKFHNLGVVRDMLADDGLPIFETIQDMQSDASDFISYVHKNNMRVHLEGKKAMNYLIFGDDAKLVTENSVKIESNSDSLNPELECLRARDVRLLGQSLSIRESDGAQICDMSSVIGRLKEAASALRGISASCLSSTAIHVIKTYIVSIMSYSFVNCYPNLFQHLNGADQKVRTI